MVCAVAVPSVMLPWYLDWPEAGAAEPISDCSLGSSVPWGADGVCEGGVPGTCAAIIAAPASDSKEIPHRKVGAKRRVAVLPVDSDGIKEFRLDQLKR